MGHIGEEAKSTVPASTRIEIEPPGRKERFSWCLFDFANSAFNTIVITFLFSAYFREALVGDGPRGDILWSGSLTIAGLVVALGAPFIGVVADRGSARRVMLIGFSLVTILCTVLLAYPSVQEGAVSASEEMIWLALVLVTVANVAFEMAFMLYNSFLPSLGDEDSVGRLSGKGWAFGYVGGLSCLAICLLMLKSGLSVQDCNLLVAGWFLVFALPMFLFVPVRGIRPGAKAASVGETMAQVLRLLRSLREFPDLTRLLIARLFYNDALIALIGLSSLYMIDTLKMEREQILMLGIWLNVAAGLGAYAFGFIDDRIGSRQAILLSLLLLIAGLVLAIALPSAGWFWLASTLVGIGMGPNQSASRSLVSRFIAPSRSAEFYGLFAFSGKATVWLGPLLFLLVIAAGGSQRLAFLPLLVLFVLGLILLLGVDEQRGKMAAVRST